MNMHKVPVLADALRGIKKDRDIPDRLCGTISSLRLRHPTIKEHQR